MADSDGSGANYGKFSYDHQQAVLKFGFPITTRLWREVSMLNLKTVPQRALWK